MGSVNSHGLLEDVNHYIAVSTDGIYGSSSRVAEQKYRVIHKSLRDFRTRVRNNQDRHGRKEHINR